MPYSILVGTPNAAFGELIRISLEENPDYRVRLVHHSGQVLATIERIPVDIAILDADLPGQSFLDLALGMLQRFQRIKLMVIPPDNNPTHPALHGLAPHAYLSKPFYLPDLLRTVERLLGAKDDSPAKRDEGIYKEEKVTRYSPMPIEPVASYSWIDVAQVEQMLAELLPGSSILESLVLQNGRLWVYAGKLSEKAVHELEGIFARHLPSGAGALIRFTRLSTGHEYLLYTGNILGDLHLVLVFPGNYPLSRMRVKAASFRDSLRQMFPTEQLKPAVTMTGWDKDGIDPMSEIDGDTRSAIDETFRNLENGESQAEVAPIDLNEILGEIPSPDPGMAEPDKTLSAEWNLENTSLRQEDFAEAPVSLSDTDRTRVKPKPGSWNKSVIEELTIQEEEAALGSLEDTQPVFDRNRVPKPDSNKPAILSGVESLPRIPPFILSEISQPGERAKIQPNSQQVKEEPGSVNHPFDWIDNEDDWAEVVRKEQKPSAGKPGTITWQKDEISDTQPLIIPKLTQIKDLETAYPAYSSLVYTFLLIPAIPTILLVGDLAAQLVRWVPQLCLAYGWRLDQVLVRPKFVQWTIRVLPYGSPGNIASTMRLQLSNQVLRHHLDLEEMLPSGEFWAPGYLVVSGPQLASNRLVEELIADIRLRQGLSEGDNQSDTIRA